MNSNKVVRTLRRSSATFLAGGLLALAAHGVTYAADGVSAPWPGRAVIAPVDLPFPVIEPSGTNDWG
ncbi:hypothetical protein ACH4TX_27040 [Streptomyces sp. NPDC021098]|uniref:hypothetical protein n=1 Tax=unclassified Streptomyces TaxID=2593676 RepID=UPI00379F923F